MEALTDRVKLAFEYGIATAARAAVSVTAQAATADRLRSECSSVMQALIARRRYLTLCAIDMDEGSMASCWE